MDDKGSVTSIEAILKIFNDGRATAQPINTLFVVRLFGFQVLNAAEHDSWQGSNLSNLK